MQHMVSYQVKLAKQGSDIRALESYDSSNQFHI